LIVFFFLLFTDATTATGAIVFLFNAALDATTHLTDATTSGAMQLSRAF